MSRATLEIGRKLGICPHLTCIASVDGFTCIDRGGCGAVFESEEAWHKAAERLIALWI